MTEADSIEYKMTRWKELSVGEDVNSINNQLVHLSKSYAIYKHLTAKRIFNNNWHGLYSKFILSSAYRSIIIDIRKQVDSYSIEGRKGVSSLYSVLADMKNFIKTNKCKSFSKEYRRILNTLVAKLQLAKKTLVKYANKFLFHAAIKESRSGSELDKTPNLKPLIELLFICFDILTRVLLNLGEYELLPYQVMLNDPSLNSDDMKIVKFEIGDIEEHYDEIREYYRASKSDPLKKLEEWKI